MGKPICPYCNEEAKLANGAEIYPHRSDLKKLVFWRCAPCGAYVGCHKNSEAEPLGRLANKELREWKQKAHAAFDPLWRKKKMSRTQAYQWLAVQLQITADECHIGMFDEETCAKVVLACDAFMRTEKNKDMKRSENLGGFIV